MSITAAQLPGILRGIADKTARAAPDCANAMGFAYQRHLVTVTLRRYTHPPQTKTPSPPGQPPALVTGTLRRSVRVDLARGLVVAAARVAPHTVYARIQELGGHIYPVRAKYLRWTEDGVVHFSKHVYLPARPYMAPALADTIANGSLTRAAAAAFMKAVWG